MARACFAASLLLTGGCSAGKLGNFDVPEPSGSTSKLGEIFGLGKKDSPASGRQLACPEIQVRGGTEVARYYSGSPPSNANLRVQFSVEDMARECSVEGDKLILKVGVAGKVLLGPAGSPGNFSVPVRVAVVRRSEQSAAASKLYRASATIPAKRTEERFTIVSEPISVPLVHENSWQDYIIELGIDSSAGSETTEREVPRR
jgi:hypothetical protein